MPEISCNVGMHIPFECLLASADCLLFCTSTASILFARLVDNQDTACTERGHHLFCKGAASTLPGLQGRHHCQVHCLQACSDHCTFQVRTSV